jgi:hypothetical protein
MAKYYVIIIAWEVPVLRSNVSANVSNLKPLKYNADSHVIRQF